MVKYHGYTLKTKKNKKKKSAKDTSNDAYVLCTFFFSDVIYESICCGYSFDLHQQDDAFQIAILNMCLYKVVDKKYV